MRAGPLVVLGAAVLWLLACFPPPLELKGKACDADHACRAPLQCLAGRCADPAPILGPDGGLAECGVPTGRANLQPNGGFEEGVAGWTAASGNIVIESASEPRVAGQRALQLSPQPGSVDGYLRAVGPREVIPPGANALCARACVIAGAPAPRSAQLTLRAHDGGSFADHETNHSPLSAESWTSLTIQFNTAGFSEFSARLALTRDPSVDATLTVDELAVWVSQDGGCP
jgi:hypothetical protein